MASLSLLKRKLRVRSSLRRKSDGRIRLSVFRSNQHIYAQVIDDTAGKTVVSASTMDDALRGVKSGSDVNVAREVGKLIAERAKKADISKVVFDRGGYVYHGRVKALAEGAREGGLDF